MQTYPEEILGEDDDNGTMVESKKELEKALIGRKIVSFERDVLLPMTIYGWTRQEQVDVITLDNGKRVKLRGESDCCAYTDLEEFFLHPENVEHAITGIGTEGEYTTWHILCDAGDVATMKVGWSPGNPFYYGYGFHIEVEDI